MTYKYSDGGRSKSKRPKQSNDCTIRALAIVTGLSYDFIFETLKVAGRKNGSRFDLEKFLRRDPQWKKVFRCQKQGRRVAPIRWKRISDFLTEHPRGRYIISTARHVSAVVDGVIHDDVMTYVIQDRPVYAWMEYLEEATHNAR